MTEWEQNKHWHAYICSMNRLFSTFLLLALFSCAPSHEGEEKPGLASQFVSISDNENAGISDVLSYFGGRCEYSIGTHVEDQGEASNFFELEISQTKALKKYSSLPQVLASNAAYRFFRNLKEERKRYTEVRTILVYAEGKKKEYAFLISDLERIDQKVRTVEKVVAWIQERDYESIQSHLQENPYFDFDPGTLIKKLNAVDLEMGMITDEWVPFGFTFLPIEDNKKLLHISGTLLRKNQNHNFSIVMEWEGEGEDIMFLNYTWDLDFKGSQ